MSHHNRLRSTKITITPRIKHFTSFSLLIYSAPYNKYTGPLTTYLWLHLTLSNSTKLFLLLKHPWIAATEVNNPRQISSTAIHVNTVGGENRFIERENLLKRTKQLVFFLIACMKGVMRHITFLVVFCFFRVFVVYRNTLICVVFIIILQHSVICVVVVLSSNTDLCRHRPVLQHFSLRCRCPLQQFSGSCAVVVMSSNTTVFVLSSCRAAL